MVDTMIRKVPSNSSVVTCYEKLTIAELAGWIVEDADRAARDEIVNRPIFFVNGGSLTLPGYIRLLKDSIKLSKYASVMLIEGAFDRTQLKFFSLPGEGNSNVDCRCYYGPFLKYLEPLICDKDVIEQERIAADKLRSFVYRHFKWSLSDAARKENFSKSYLWNIDGVSYRLQMATVMTGAQCKKWLEENISRPDTKNTYEQQRIQQIIDEHLFVPSMIPLRADSFDTFTSKTISPLGELIENEMKKDGRDLSVCIAEEKSDNLDSLRASIARLGRDKVRKLVIAIFDEISTDSFRPSVLGRKFGLSPAAMTRFASLKWDRCNGNNIPQLWANTARYVVNLPQYSKILYETGLYDKVSSIVLED